VELSAAIGNIDYNNEYFSSTYNSVHLELNYLSNIKSLERSKVYLGGQLASVLNVLEYDRFESGGWYTAQELEVVAAYKYFHSEKVALSGQLSYPIAGLVSRPSYGGIDEYVVANSFSVPKVIYGRKQFYSLDRLINPSLELKYSYSFRKLVLSIAGEYSYLQVNSVRKYFKNEWSLGLEFQLKIGN